MHLAVNLSVSNLQDAGLPAQVQMLLDAIGVPAEALVLEITEDILMADAERSHQVLAGLQALGVRLAVAGRPDSLAVRPGSGLSHRPADEPLGRRATQP